MATRTAEEIFAHHGQVLGAGRIDDIVDDYGEDSFLIFNDEVLRGKDGARAVFTQLLEEVPEATWDLSTVFADDVLYLEWKARSAKRHVDDGIDTFVVGNDKIRVQTAKYSVHPG
jgi:hypothetical protein